MTWHMGCGLSFAPTFSSRPPRLTHPPGTTTAQAFSHLALVCSLLPSIRANPHSRSKCELLVPSRPYAGLHNLYHAANDWWEEVALVSQTIPFPLSSSPSFSGRIQHLSFLSLAGICLGPYAEQGRNSFRALLSLHGRCEVLFLGRSQAGQCSFTTQPFLFPTGLCGRLPVFTPSV